MRTTKEMNVALYLRVSTDGQSVNNQRRDLEAVSERAGWKIVDVYQDKGISGAKGRNGRPELNRMMEEATRRRFRKLLVWDLSRLGRSLRDLINITDHFKEVGVDLYVHKDAIDTGTASGRLFFHIVGAIGEFERERIRERIKAGLARARAEQASGKPRIGKNGRSKKAIGRPKGTTKGQVKHQANIVSLRGTGMSIRKIASTLRVSTSTVQTALKRGKVHATDDSNVTAQKPTHLFCTPGEGGWGRSQQRDRDIYRSGNFEITPKGHLDFKEAQFFQIKI
jgi:DNA invertase Pin-like site-specific DNA recombinase